MEEITKDRKDLLTLSFVVILIIIGIIGCCLLFLKPTKNEDKKEQQKEVEKTDINVPEETIEQLISILGIKENNSKNEIINSFANKDFTTLEDDIILDLFIESRNKIDTVDSSLCKVGPNIETCNKYLKSDFIDFLKEYDFTNNFDYILNETDEYIYLNSDVNDFSTWTHTYKAKYGSNNNDDYITINDILYLSYEILDQPFIKEEEYNYIFKKSTDETKSEYYLIKVERVD